MNLLDVTEVIQQIFLLDNIAQLVAYDFGAFNLSILYCIFIVLFL